MCDPGPALSLNVMFILRLSNVDKVLSTHKAFWSWKDPDTSRSVLSGGFINLDQGLESSSFKSQTVNI